MSFLNIILQLIITLFFFQIPSLFIITHYFDRYLLFVMRADHQREGGVFALLSLILFGTDEGKHNVVSKQSKY